MKEEFRILGVWGLGFGLCPGCWLGFQISGGVASIWLGAANS